MHQNSIDPRSIRSREWIFKALKELLAATEYDKITVIMLTDRAGVGRSTFYRNYSRMDDVLLEQIHQKLDDFDLFLEQTVPGSSAGFPLMLLDPMFRFWMNDSSLLELLLRAERIQLFHQAVLARQSFLSQSMVAGLPYRHAQFVRGVGISMLTTALVQWVSGGKQETPEELARLVSRYLFEGGELVQNLPENHQP